MCAERGAGGQASSRRSPSRRAIASAALPHVQGRRAAHPAAAHRRAERGGRDLPPADQRDAAGAGGLRDRRRRARRGLRDPPAAPRPPLPPDGAQRARRRASQPSCRALAVGIDIFPLAQVEALPALLESLSPRGLSLVARALPSASPRPPRTPAARAACHRPSACRPTSARRARTTRRYWRCQSAPAVRVAAAAKAAAARAVGAHAVAAAAPTSTRTCRRAPPRRR